jgi:ABC-type amino acid transport substrate-binding protein
MSQGITMKPYISILLSSFILVLIAHISTVNAADFDSLEIMTEDFPPFNYSENGKATGIAVALLLNASAAVGKPIKTEKINLITWARAYQTTLTGPNAMLFSMTRTDAREHLFKWAGPIGQNRLVVLAKKSSNIGQIGDISKTTENIGVVRDTVGDQLIVAAGVPSDKIKANSKPRGATKMLTNNRIKLWAYSENSGFKQLTEIGENIDDYEIVHVLKSSELYFAFSKDVDDEIIALLQKGIDSLAK